MTRDGSPRFITVDYDQNIDSLIHSVIIIVIRKLLFFYVEKNRNSSFIYILELQAHYVMHCTPVVRVCRTIQLQSIVRQVYIKFKVVTLFFKSLNVIKKLIARFTLMKQRKKV